MSFKARKTRERKKPDPMGVGKPLTPSAAIRIWYRDQMRAITKAMIEDYRKEIAAVMEQPEVERLYAQDSASSLIEQVMFRLRRKWHEIFLGFSAQIVPKFIEKVDTHSKSTTYFSLKAIGENIEPKETYTENVARIWETSGNFNRTLITGIAHDVDKTIYDKVMLSLTSPNVEEQGTSGIQNALRQAGEFSKERIDLISRDQTSKLNSSLCTERMQQNGVSHFKWLHSGIDEKPHFRLSHQKMNNVIFEVDDPRLWEVGGEFGLKKGDLGPPGWAINCRCRAVPVIGYSDD